MTTFFILLAFAIFVVWAITSRSKEEAERKAQEQREADARAREEAIKRKEQARREEAERLSKIITSTTNMVFGRRVMTQFRVISISNAASSHEAERQFLLAVEAAGGNGAVNVRIRPHRGGMYSAQGDAVRLAEAT